MYKGEKNVMNEFVLTEWGNKYKLSELIDCSDKSLKASVHHAGKYWKFYNYVIAKKQFHCYEAITLTLHAHYTDLYYLEDLVKLWLGPISVAVYSPGHDFYLTLNTIAYLRNCRSFYIKDFITFHVYFSTEDLPFKVKRFDYILDCNLK